VLQSVGSSVVWPRVSNARSTHVVGCNIWWQYQLWSGWLRLRCDATLHQKCQSVTRSLVVILSPVHTSNNVEATLLNATCWTILSTKSNLLWHFAVFGNIVAGFGNNVKWNFVLSTKWKQIEHVKFLSTLSKAQNFTKNSFDIVAKNGNSIIVTFDFVERTNDTLR